MSDTKYLHYTQTLFNDENMAFTSVQVTLTQEKIIFSGYADFINYSLLKEHLMHPQ